MDLSNLIAGHLVGTKYQDIPEEAIEAAKKEVIDSLATALGGTTKPGVPELVTLAKEWGGAEQSSIFGYGIKCPAPIAAQVNGTMIHALDYDDGHPVSLTHVGCVAVSTSFAAAERVGQVSGRDLLAAIALGGDFVCRMGLASKPGGSALGAGWHPTTLFGFLSAAGMAGRIFKLNEEQMLDAIGLAYHQCGGAGTGVGDGALAKRMGPGLAAKAGLTSALMAERGITGDRHFLGSDNWKGGIFNVYYGGDYDANILTKDLGKQFEGVNIGDKPYPCCGFTHPFIDATFTLMKKYGVTPDRIDSITARGGQQVYGMMVGEAKIAPRTIVDAQFSVPWTVATALVKGKVTLHSFTPESIKDGDVIAVARKVSGVLDTSMNRHGVGPGRLTMNMKDGQTLTEEVEDFLGSINNPMSFDNCADKLRECVEFAVKPISKEKVEKVIDLTRHLEQVIDVGEITRLLG
jgi:2-methylcitrate dehydratase PrpD